MGDGGFYFYCVWRCICCDVCYVWLDVGLFWRCESGDCFFVCRNGGFVAVLVSFRCMGCISGCGVNWSWMFVYFFCVGCGGG